MDKALAIIIQALNAGIAAGAAIEYYVALKDRLEAMHAEGRDPTAAEWDALLAETEALTAQLQA